ncbi:DUF2905 domain-containing protein [Candidatus Gottesmanbacteria bacterium]|nr:DUF2905 domain-containing protein [Candidatus Gottesmanbacteria bacterium]
MQALVEIGRTILVIIILSIFLGVMVTFAGGIPLIGKLPGDLYIRKGPIRFYLPLTSSIIISLVLTWILNTLR